MSQFGITIQNIAEDIIKAKADQEYARAKIEGYKQLSQLEAEASQDNDFQDFEPKYSKRIKDIQENISKTIRSPQAKRAFEQDFELKSTYSFYDITSNARKRFLDYDKDLMAQELAATKERYFSATTTQEKQNAQDELAQIFSRRVENKILNKAEAANLYKKEMATLDEGQAEYKIYNDISTQEEDSIILAELKKGKQGAYPELTQDKRLDLIKKSQQRIFNNNQTYKRDLSEAQEIRHSSVLDKLSTNTLTLRDIEAELQIPEEKGGIKRKILISYRNALERGIESDLKKIISEKDSRGKPTDRAKNAKKYLDLIDKFIDDESDLWEAREFLADAYGDGIINSKEQKYLNELRKNLNDIKWNRQAGIIKSTIEWTKNRLRTQSNPPDWEIALRIKQLLDEIQGGKSPQEAANQVISDQIDSDIIKSSKEQPQKRIFANNSETGQRIYSDDGGETWYDEKTGELVK